MERIAFHELPGGFLNPLLKVQEYVDSAGLDASLLTLVRMRVSQINSCAYCLDMHYKEGIEAGETPLRLISVGAWREAPYYSLKEEAVLAFAEHLTKLPGDVSSEGLHDDLNKYFSKQEIAFLTLAIVQINSWNRIVRSFGTEAGKYQVKKKERAVPA
ncbi:MAG: carboxymuconolactone decarboxylase family protein [Chryseosolibacter sp.]